MATAQEGSIGLIRRALVLRAKYRIPDEKDRIPLSILGVHPFNRAGLYPMEETVMNLGLSILSGGFSVDEANHEGCMRARSASSGTANHAVVSRHEVRAIFSLQHKENTIS